MSEDQLPTKDKLSDKVQEENQLSPVLIDHQFNNLYFPISQLEAEKLK